MQKQRCPFSQSHARRGTLLVEAIVGAIILGAAISMLLPTMSAVRRQRQSLRFESLALVELNNLDEALPAAIDPKQLPKLSEWFQKRYSKSQMEAELLPLASEAEASLQPIRLTIHQPTYESMPEIKVSLVIWRTVQESAP